MKACAAFVACLLTLIGISYQHELSTMGYEPILQYNTEELVSLASNSTPRDYNVFHNISQHKLAKYPPNKRGCRGGANLIRPIKVHITGGKVSRKHPHKGVNYDNLLFIRPAIKAHNHSQNNGLLDACLLNTRSVRNKTLLIKDYMVDHNADIFLMTETWLKTDDEDMVKIGELEEDGYKLRHVPRKHTYMKKGGGVGVLHKTALTVKPKNQAKYKAFEYMEIVIKTTTKSVRTYVVYYPGEKREHQLTHKVFLEDFSSFLEQVTITTGHLLIAGDFNYHVDDCNDTEALQFLSLLDTFGLVQHINVPTHKKGHTLDLVITRDGDSLVSNILVNPPGISDHCPIHFKIDLVKPGPIRREIIFRKMRNIDRHQFQEDITQSELINHPVNTLPDLVDQYHSVLEEILNRHAPLKKAVITIRPHADWFNDEIKEARQKRRKLEKKWRSKPLGERLQVDEEMYADQCKVVRDLVISAKQSHR
jgi:exonuclease III